MSLVKNTLLGCTAKTASRRPARVFVNKDSGTLMNIYYYNVQCVIKPLCTEYESRFFSHTNRKSAGKLNRKKLTKLPIFSMLKLPQLPYIGRWFQQKQKQKNRM